MLSKFVFQPLVDPIVTVVQLFAQLVLSVAKVFIGTATLTVVLPAQAKLTVEEATPPLYAWMLKTLRGATNVKGCDVGPDPEKLMLFVVNNPKGPERNQAPVPQSM